VSPTALLAESPLGSPPVVVFRGRDGRIWSFDEKDRIGEPGGFGEVFRGLGHGNAAVAIKRCRLRHDDEAHRRRRDREVEIADLIAAGSNVEHLLTPIDVGLNGDDLLLVLPLADESLRAALDRSSLDEAKKLDAIGDVVRGLVELAELSILHRDLKPHNVLRVDGLWHIADFGISRDLAASTGTYTFAGAGAYPYMAPELWLNQPGTVKTDLYALGVLAYEVIAGTRPFPGPDEGAFRDQHLHAAPPALPETTPPTLARLILRLLAKQPAERPQDARWVLDQLGSVRRRLNPTQRNLQQTALVARQRTAEEDARRAATETAAAVERDRRTQALADLDAILQDAADLVREALPDAQCGRANNVWVASLDGVGIGISAWEHAPRAEDQNRPDPLIVAGDVRPWRRRELGAIPMANIVCESDHAGRQVWSLLRFRAMALVTPNYRLGPPDREHGFSPQTFAEQRIYMLLGGMHIWTRNTYVLTADLIATLLNEALTAQ
jgi:hypothetical protein